MLPFKKDKEQKKGQAIHKYLHNQHIFSHVGRMNNELHHDDSQQGQIYWLVDLVGWLKKKIGSNKVYPMPGAHSLWEKSSKGDRGASEKHHTELNVL